MPHKPPCRRRTGGSLLAVLLVAVCALGFALPAAAQPGVAYTFGIDGNLLANSPGGIFLDTDDWLDGPAGIGVGVLNNDGTPRDPVNTFHVVDLTGNADLDVFAESNKVFDDPTTYNWKAGSVPQKDDIQNGLIHVYTDNDGDLWVSMAGDRRAINGDSYIDFEFLQSELYKNPDGTFTSLGPDGGRTVGDILLTIELTRGGSQAEFFAQQWQPDPDNPGMYTYLDFTPPAGTGYVAANIDSMVAVPYGAFGSTMYGLNQFGEAGANLTEIIQGIDECYGIATVFIRTKSSASATAELKDMINPIQLSICLDETPPTITCPAEAFLECDEDTSAAALGFAYAEDNCDENPVITYNDVIIPGRCPQAYTIERTWTATDECGNTATCLQLIHVDDTIAPELTGCPTENPTYQCLSDVPAPATVTATDNCDNDVPVIFDEQSDGSCPTTITRTWTATDDCGNSVSCSQTIIVDDTTDPVLSGCPEDAQYQCLSDVPAPANVTATDNCDGAITPVFDEQQSGTCPTTITRTWTATDACGNEVSCSQTIVVDDTTDPVLSGCPTETDLSVACMGDVPPPANVTATDNCDGTLTVNFNEVDDGNTCPKVITRTWTTSDACGNEVSCSQTITVNDTTDPVLSGCPEDLNVQCMGDVPPPANVTATDNCDGAITPVYNEVDDGNTCPKTITRTWTATDDCGNEVSCSQTIVVNDTTDPVLSGCPTDTDLSVACMGDVPPPANVTATDNCDGTLTVNFNEVDDGNTCPKVITRTWTASDACGNEVSCSQTITVNDTTDPVLSGCPDDVNVQCMGDVPPPANVTATDNCDGAITPVYNEVDDGNTCPKTITRTWTATDACGNEVSCSQTIVVNDTTDPVLSGCPDDVNVQCMADVPNPANVTATDNCDGTITPVYNEVDDGNTCPKTLTRTWTATDACGNEVSCSQTIVVNDTTDPVLSGCPDDVNVQCMADVPNPANVTATDNCDGTITPVYNEVDDGNTCPKTLTRTWTATDACGNEVSCTQTIVVNDTTDPVLSGCPDDVNVQCMADVPNPANVTATDNCDGTITPVYNEVDDGNTCPKTITRTWTATDACGNEVSCSQTIVINDTTDPVLSGCPDDVNAQCMADVPNPANVTATDNCDGTLTVNYNEVDDGNTCPKTITRTWTASDACGNEVSCSQTIVIDDTTDPVLSGCPEPTASFQCYSDVPAAATVTATDNCDGTLTVNFNEVESNPGSSCDNTITRTWSASDACGNDAMCTQIITVNDDTDPTISCPNDTIIDCGAEPVFGDPVYSDNCDPDPELIIVSTVTTPGATANSYTVTRTWKVRDFCGNESNECSQSITVECPEEFCSFTQGFYGNYGGKFNGESTLEIIMRLLEGNPLTVGVNGRSLTIPYESAYCVLALLPGGGPSTYLPAIGNDTILASASCHNKASVSDPTLDIPVNKQGRWTNTLLAQTVTLTLNARYDGNLCGFELMEAFCTQAALPGPDGIYNTEDDVVNPMATIHHFSILSSVLSALDDLGLDNSVCGLIELANRGLGMMSTGGASLSDIAYAVDTINNAFDECAFLVTCPIYDPMLSKSGKGTDDLGPQLSGDGSTPSVPVEYGLGQNYPNPFNPVTTITISLPEAASWKLAIYNTSGQLVKRFDGSEGAAAYVNIEWDGTNEYGVPVASGVYLYRVKAGTFTATKKMILLK